MAEPGLIDPDSPLRSERPELGTRQMSLDDVPPCGQREKEVLVDVPGGHGYHDRPDYGENQQYARECGQR